MGLMAICGFETDSPVPPNGSGEASMSIGGFSIIGGTIAVGVSFFDKSCSSISIVGSAIGITIDDGEEDDGEVDGGPMRSSMASLSRAWIAFFRSMVGEEAPGIIGDSCTIGIGEVTKEVDEEEDLSCVAEWEVGRGMTVGVVSAALILTSSLCI